MRVFYKINNIIALLIISLALTFFSCSKNTPEKNCVINIYLNAENYNLKKYFNSIIKDFENDEACQINWLLKNRNNLNSIDSLRPDIIEFSEDELLFGESAERLMQIDKNEVEHADYQARHLEFAAQDDRYIALPWIIKPKVLIINLNKLKQFDIDISDADSLDGFIKLCEEMHSPPSGYGFAGDILDENSFFDVFLYIVRSNGGAILDSLGNIHLNTKLNRSALSKYFQLMHNSSFSSDGENRERFLEGKIAFVISNTDFIEDLLNMELDFKISYKPLPVYKTSKEYIPQNTYFLGIDKSSDNKEEALKLIKYLNSERALLSFAKDSVYPGVPAAYMQSADTIQYINTRYDTVIKLLGSSISPQKSFYDPNIKKILHQEILEALKGRINRNAVLRIAQKRIDAFNKSATISKHK